MIGQLQDQLKAITGFDAIAIQPNSGAQGEYTGLLAIRRFHKANGQPNRDVCLIPKSAHGTNPATAQMLGMKVVAGTQTNWATSYCRFTRQSRTTSRKLGRIDDYLSVHAWCV